MNEPFVAEATPTRRDLLALRILQLGAVAVVLVASTYKVFELDRFFVPKELVLHLTAFLCGLLVLQTFRRITFTRVDLVLLTYLALSALSALFATNHWVALRAVSVSVSGIAIFWVARALREAGYGRRVLVGLALAVIIGVMTSLAQTYGIQSDFFSLNRAPGGTLGNRNFIAHLAAFGLPVIMLLALQAGRRIRYLGGAIGVAVVVAVLILTRSRAAWLAFAGGVFVILLAMVVSPQLRRSGRTWVRLFGVVVVAGLAVGIAVFAPNSLKWNSEHPYLQSMKGVTNFQEGSGHGRLIQYQRSLRMATAHAFLGVGPGNWAVDYPEHAARRDPSLNRSEPGTTANPWPSSDWVSYVSERGFLAAMILFVALFGIGIHGLVQLVRAQTLNDALAAAALVATLLAANIAGAFDAVLLLAQPTLLVWAALGALYCPRENDPRPARAGALVVASVIALLGAVRSGAQLYGMSVYASTWSPRALVRASSIDPGNYDLHMRIARSGAKRSVRCEHARAAHDLYPSAAAARSASASCGTR